MDLLLPIALDLTRDPHAAFDLLEQHTVAAHGYATLHMSGFLRGRAPEVADVAESAAKPSHTLAIGAQRQN